MYDSTSKSAEMRLICQNKAVCTDTVFRGKLVSEMAQPIDYKFSFIDKKHCCESFTINDVGLQQEEP